MDLDVDLLGIDVGTLCKNESVYICRIAVVVNEGKCGE